MIEGKKVVVGVSFCSFLCQPSKLFVGFFKKNFFAFFLLLFVAFVATSTKKRETNF
tara:strand:+ start:161 stop:328 length:168 start_codon:yes stop_codon:yes gene_type:complete